MAVQLNDIQSGSTVAPHGRLTLHDTRHSGLFAPLLRLCHPRCPDCGRRGMVCRYIVPDSYNEPSPRYFECEHCAARYFRMVTGPWFPAGGPEFAHCYAVGMAKAA